MAHEQGEFSGRRGQRAGRADAAAASARRCSPCWARRARCWASAAGCRSTGDGRRWGRGDACGTASGAGWGGVTGDGGGVCAAGAASRAWRWPAARRPGARPLRGGRRPAAARPGAPGGLRRRAGRRHATLRRAGARASTRPAAAPTVTAVAGIKDARQADRRRRPEQLPVGLPRPGHRRRWRASTSTWSTASRRTSSATRTRCSSRPSHRPTSASPAIQAGRVDMVVRTMTINCDRLHARGLLRALLQDGPAGPRPQVLDDHRLRRHARGKKVCTAAGSTADTKLADDRRPAGSAPASTSPPSPTSSTAWCGCSSARSTRWSPTARSPPARPPRTRRWTWWARPFTDEYYGVAMKQRRRRSGTPGQPGARRLPVARRQRGGVVRHWLAPRPARADRPPAAAVQVTVGRDRHSSER